MVLEHRRQPWLAADTARAGTHSLLTLGVVMKTKLAVGVALLALLSVALLSSDLFRSGQTEHAPRSPDPSADPSTRSAAAPEVSAEDAGPAARAKTANAPLPAPVDLEAVDRHRDLHGIVVHRDGTPLAGAELQVLAYPWRRASTLNMDTYDSAVEGPATLSARDGTFALRLQRGDLRHLRVSAPDMASRQVPLVQAGERMKIVMDAGVQVHVQAIESDGSPAKDAKLRLFHAGSSGSHNLELSGVTGDDGRFSFQVAAGPSRGWVEAERADMGSTGWVEFNLPEEGELTLEAKFPPARTITGVVIDADSKQPIANARVGMNWTQSRSVFTDDNGRYTLPGWTGGGVSDIHVSADGYGQDSAVVEKRDVVDFSLVKGDSARGRVIDQHGRPVAGARVSAIGSVHRGGRQTSSRRHAETDAGGRFLVRGLRRDLYHALVVMAPGFGRQLIDFGPVPDGPGTFDPARR